jgi:predicted N-acetyltransferase YhbS
LYQITDETAADYHEVEALFDLCFAPGRTALSSYRLRDDVPPVSGLSKVARDDEKVLAGAIRYWPARIGPSPTLLMGPVAVHPTRQGEGLAALLIRETMARGAEFGWERVLLVGDAPYYARFGFVKLDHVSMPPPTNPERVLGHALRHRAWDGIVGEVVRWDAD